MSEFDRKPVVNSSTGSFRLDKADGKIFGVCAGIGNYFGIDPLIVRLGFVLGTLIGFGSFILIYLAIALIAK